ncbi:MAG: 2OG-Fe(II) oxygenase [Campylobacterota bacterium]
MKNDFINRKLVQISNNIYCSDSIFNLDIETKLLPNCYYDYPYLIIDDFLSQEECLLINKNIQKSSNYQKASLRTLDIVPDETLNEDIRKTFIYKISPKYIDIYTTRFKQNQNRIENYFNLCMTKSTKLQALEYLENYFYAIHSDDSSMIYEKEALVGFKPVAKNRKLTTVLFTTSYDEKSTGENSFNGGELVFNFLFDKNREVVKIRPKMGQLIVFPSNPFFCHEVKKVKSGRRVSLVQWHDAILN